MLVHCYAGQSRSVAFVLAYLCAHQGLSLADAYALVLAARPCAKPNAGALVCCCMHLACSALHGHADAPAASWHARSCCGC